MAEYDSLEWHIFTRGTVHGLTSSGQKVVRASNDVDELITLRARLRSIAAGRGLWLLWAWLLLLGGSWIQAEGVFAYALIVVWLTVLVVIVNYVSGVRRSANSASEWLSEIDFRLAQLAARGEDRDPSQP